MVGAGGQGPQGWLGRRPQSGPQSSATCRPSASTAHVRNSRDPPSARFWLEEGAILRPRTYFGVLGGGVRRQGPGALSPGCWPAVLPASLKLASAGSSPPTAVEAVPVLPLSAAKALAVCPEPEHLGTCLVGGSLQSQNQGLRMCTL